MGHSERGGYGDRAGMWGEEKAPLLRVGAADELALWPIASTEQHGPHLPTGTDSIISEALQAGLLANPADFTLRILPTLTIGASDHHMAFGGTLSLPPVQYTRVLVQGLRSLLGQGHHWVLLLNSHGGNHAPMLTALAEAAGDFARAHALCGGLSYWQVCGEAWKAVDPPLVTTRLGHACEIETSLILALRPDLVDMERAVDCPFHESIQQGVGSGLQFDEITPNGVIGFPSCASDAKGRQILQIAVREVRDAIRNWLASSPGKQIPLR